MTSYWRANWKHFHISWYKYLYEEAGSVVRCSRSDWTRAANAHLCFMSVFTWPFSPLCTQTNPLFISIQELLREISTSVFCFFYIPLCFSHSVDHGILVMCVNVLAEHCPGLWVSCVRLFTLCIPYRTLRSEPQTQASRLPRRRLRVSLIYAFWASFSARRCRPISLQCSKAENSETK